jgi:hypothetical protein
MSRSEDLVDRVEMEEMMDLLRLLCVLRSGLGGGSAQMRCVPTIHCYHNEDALIVEAWCA